MIKPRDPSELAEDLVHRSICAVQVAAVIADKDGIFSWGWNHVGSGYGTHAESHAIQRANKQRLHGATIYVAARRQRTTNPITAKPCEDCQRLIDKWQLKVKWRDPSNQWQSIGETAE